MLGRAGVILLAVEVVCARALLLRPVFGGLVLDAVAEYAPGEP
jgi:hypothetical protein